MRKIRNSLQIDQCPVAICAMPTWAAITSFFLFDFPVERPDKCVGETSWIKSLTGAIVSELLRPAAFPYA